MTTMTSEHCFGVRFRTSMPFSGEARIGLAASISAAPTEKDVRMTLQLDSVSALCKLKIEG